MSKVLVMMSTFNGEKYLREQLDSILSQKEVEIEVDIRDDGSKDHTLNILKEYREKNDNIKIYTGPNLKPAKSFMWLVQNSSVDQFDYYSFCDQDDFWLEDKLMTAEKLLNQYKEIPAMYYSAVTTTDDSLKPNGNFFTKQLHTQSMIDSIAKGSLIPGCSIVFNKQLMMLLQKYDPKKITMHDSWVHLVCLACSGKVIGDPNSHILYRQHESNVVGAKKRSISLRMKQMALNNRVYSTIAKEILEGYESSLDPHMTDLLHNCSDYLDDQSSKYNLIRNALKSTLSVKDRMIFAYKIMLQKF